MSVRKKHFQNQKIVLWRHFNILVLNNTKNIIKVEVYEQSTYNEKGIVLINMKSKKTILKMVIK